MEFEDPDSAPASDQDGLPSPADLARMSEEEQLQYALYLSRRDAKADDAVDAMDAEQTSSSDATGGAPDMPYEQPLPAQMYVPKYAGDEDGDPAHAQADGREMSSDEDKLMAHDLPDDPDELARWIAHVRREKEKLARMGDKRKEDKPVDAPQSPDPGAADAGPTRRTSATWDEDEGFEREATMTSAEYLAAEPGAHGHRFRWVGAED